MSAEELLAAALDRSLGAAERAAAARALAAGGRARGAPASAAAGLAAAIGAAACARAPDDELVGALEAALAACPSASADRPPGVDAAAERMPLLASLRQPGLGEVGTGGTVWPAAVALATALLGAAAHTRERALAQRARSVLELGSGCGLCGLAAFHAAADATTSAEAVAVTLTDVAPEVLRNLEVNARAVEAAIGARASELPCGAQDFTVRVRSLHWGDASGLDSEDVSALCDREEASGGRFDGIQQRATPGRPQRQQHGVVGGGGDVGRDNGNANGGDGGGGSAPEELEFETLEDGLTFDLVLAADCAYEWPMCATLAATVAERLADGGAALLTTTLRPPSGTAMAAELARRLGGNGLRVAITEAASAGGDGAEGPHGEPLRVLQLTCDRRAAPHAWRVARSTAGATAEATAPGTQLDSDPAPAEPRWCVAGQESAEVEEVARGAVR